MRFSQDIWKMWFHNLDVVVTEQLKENIDEKNWRILVTNMPFFRKSLAQLKFDSSL